MVGSAIVRTLQHQGYSQLLLRDREQLDLRDRNAVKRFFLEKSPEVIFLCAAKVGGIVANQDLPAEFIGENLSIQTNVIVEAHHAGVQHMIFLGSSCIYPRDCPQPIKEDYLLTGPLEQSNRPYAIAKIAGIEMCWSFNRQYGTRYLAVMPCNLYGPGDNYHPDHSHVIPGLIRRMHDAKQSGTKSITAWGSGTPRRELLFSDDLGEACVFLQSLPTNATQFLFNNQSPPLLNIGTGVDMPVKELASFIRKTVGFKGTIRWNTNKPDGTPRKLLSTSQLSSLGWRPNMDFPTGLQLAYLDFLKRYG